jgi:predicted DNA-binding mobile mystery protein A
MRVYERERLRRDLDESLLPFRLVRKRKGKPKHGWVRGIREAVGIPVEELAQRMGVCRWEIRRLEMAEEDSRIQLGTLRRAAEGLGCELVYALVPKEGALEGMAAAQTQVRERAQAKRRQEREAAKEPFLEFLGWRDSLMKAMRARLRREGYRVRPAKTDRGVAQELADFAMNVRVLKVTGMWAPFMTEFMGEQEKLKREGEGKIEAGGDAS